MSWSWSSSPLLLLLSSCIHTRSAGVPAVGLVCLLGQKAHSLVNRQPTWLTRRRRSCAAAATAGRRAAAAAGASSSVQEHTLLVHLQAGLQEQVLHRLVVPWVDVICRAFCSVCLLLLLLLVVVVVVVVLSSRRVRCVQCGCWSLALACVRALLRK